MTKDRLQKTPSAWLHTMHYEKGNGNRKRVTLDKQHPFGWPGVDYSAEYRITSVPLFKKAKL